MGVGDKQNKIGHELIIVEAEFWVHGNSLYFSLYFYVCFKFSIKWQKKKYSSCALATQFFSFKDNQISVSYHFL